MVTVSFFNFLNFLNCFCDNDGFAGWSLVGGVVTISFNFLNFLNFFFAITIDLCYNQKKTIELFLKAGN